MGVEHVTVAHGDLPMATGIGALDPFDGVTLVPDRYSDGTNIIRVPVRSGFRFSYGPGSFQRHLAECGRLGMRGPGGAPARTGLRRGLAGRPGGTVTPADDAPGPGRRVSRLANDATGADHLTVDLPTPDRALAVGAHPDDIEFGCGATLAKWAADGCTIHHLVLTDGAKGTWDPEQDTALAGRRSARTNSARRPAGSAAATSASSADPTASCATASPSSGRCAGGSGRSDPTSCSAMTRGVATGCTPTTATPASS